MKKQIIIIITLFVALVAQGQNEHFKFMGIPIDGKISSFDKELQKKGFKLDDIMGKSLEDAYIYNGIFAGENAQIYVNYDVKSKIVYQAVVIIKRSTKESVTRLYQDMRDMLEEKYSQDEGVRFIEDQNEKYGEEMKKNGIDLFQWKHIAEKDGYETTSFFIPNVKSRDLLGLIEVFGGDMLSNVTYTTDYLLFIKYIDWQNSNSQRDNRMDDL